MASDLKRCFRQNWRLIFSKMVRLKYQILISPWILRIFENVFTIHLELNSTSIVKTAKVFHIERVGQGEEKASFWEQLDLVLSQELVKQEVLGLSRIRYSENGESYLDVFFPFFVSFPHDLFSCVVPSPSSSAPPTSEPLSQLNDIGRLLADLENRRWKPRAGECTGLWSHLQAGVGVLGGKSRGTELFWFRLHHFGQLKVCGRGCMNEWPFHSQRL